MATDIKCCEEKNVFFFCCPFKGEGRGVSSDDEKVTPKLVGLHKVIDKVWQPLETASVWSIMTKY